MTPVAPASCETPRPAIGVAIKRVPLRVEVNALTGAVFADDRLAGLSPADQAALEHALRLGDEWGWDVVVATVGEDACRPLLREALACGATRAVLVPLPMDAAAPVVAASLASAVETCAVILCGDRSLDRGTGAVPAFLAALRGASQALGLTSLTSAGPGVVVGERRLDGGRRERLRATAPTVLSVEAAGLRLRRASLSGLLRARGAPIDVRPAPVPYALDPGMGTRRPYRPRPKSLPAPAATLSARERVLALTGVLVNRRPPAVVRTDDPAQAADALLAFLHDRHYIP